ncbi:hypothetical protein D3C77_381720 [compost metagenome]
MQGDRQHEQPHPIDPFGLRPARAGAFVFVRGEAVKAQHQQDPKAHADHHRQRCVGTVAGDLAGGVQARQYQRERTGGEHHAGGKAKHHVLATSADFTQYHSHDRAQCRSGKPRKAAEHGHMQVFLVVAVYGVPGAGQQQAEYHHQAQAQSGAQPGCGLRLLQPCAPEGNRSWAAGALDGGHKDLTETVRWIECNQRCHGAANETPL